MSEVLLKTHLIITAVHEEYSIKWIGKILDTKPKIKNGRPIFVIIGGGGRLEMNTANMKEIERCAKLITRPKGRSAVTTDMAKIFIVEEDGNEKLLGVVRHDHIKNYAPMFDKFEYI